MRKLVIAAGTAMALFAVTTPSFSMGSGSTGGAGEYGGSAGATGDYAIAIHLIKHEMYSRRSRTC
ncbi:MAG: hypothetical protein WDN03_16100 [Rhizomicrobium sp.]